MCNGAAGIGIGIGLIMGLAIGFIVGAAVEDAADFLKFKDKRR